MARSYTATSHRITAGTRAIPRTAGTLAVWWYPTFAQTDGLGHVVFDVRDSGNIFHLLKNGSNQLSAGWIVAATEYKVNVASANYTLNQNAWNSIVLTWDDAANETRLYLNGTLIGTTSTLVTWTTTGTRYIGNSSGLANDARGRLAELVICDRIWSSGERAAFDAGVLPYRIGATDSYYSLGGGDTDEPDLSGNGNTGTVTGPTRGDHAPVLPISVPFR
ncbi:MAG: LamG domain-containing protein [Actinomycetota bacterium]